MKIYTIIISAVLTMSHPALAQKTVTCPPPRGRAHKWRWSAEVTERHACSPCRREAAGTTCAMSHRAVHRSLPHHGG
jgi:hypothetical protein